jgi:hypothetical protein
LDFLDFLLTDLDFLVLTVLDLLEFLGLFEGYSSVTVCFPIDSS